MHELILNLLKLSFIVEVIVLAIILVIIVSV